MGPFFTRRQTLGSGLAVAAATLGPPVALGQTGGFRLIHARAGGYDSAAPGPVLRVRRGEELKVRLVNELSTATTIHWHGVRVPNAMDGTALTQAPVAPGASFDYRFTPPDAGTFWYRPPLRIPQNRALHGLLIVDEAQPVDVDRDIAMALDAWPSDANAAKDSPAQITVNGLPSLDIPVVANERIRLRLLNASPSAWISVRIDRHPATVMATDGQPGEPYLAGPLGVLIAPGRRLDLFVDAVRPPSSVEPIIGSERGNERPIARLVYADGPPRQLRATPPRPLPASALPERMDLRNALRPEWTIAEETRDAAPDKALFSVRRGRTVVLALRSTFQWGHTLHLHGHSARVLDALDDGWKPYWLDTLPVLPPRTTRIAFVADNPGKWLLHAQRNETEGATLAWFEVS